ncbi:MAG: hypothetical protein CMB81_01970 [Flammeovirgaceae bacterium]|nr:hypothetical protein [Flammeovirgaceae bacterium]
MKISASLYSNKNKKLETLTEELDSVNIDMFHIDFNDKKIGIDKIEDDIKRIRKVSNTTIDLHIISEKPSKYDNFILRNNIERVAYQFEDIKENEFEIPNFQNTQFGLAITSKTNIEVFKKYSGNCSYVLLMTTTPGESGGKFNMINFKKIRHFKSLFPSKSIHVDGGINDEIGFVMRILGVQSVVSGSFLVKENIAKSLLKLKSSVVNSELKVREFMISKEECPIIDEESSISDILKKINDYDFGYVLVENINKEFVGIISMADVRKGLIKKKFDIKNIEASDIINNNPVTIGTYDNINYMLKTIQNHDFLISFIPVVDDKKIKGSITFFNLINSES